MWNLCLHEVCATTKQAGNKTTLPHNTGIYIAGPRISWLCTQELDFYCNYLSSVNKLLRMAQTSTSSLAYTLNADSFEFLGSTTPLNPTESFILPHYDFLSFLGVAQQSGVNFLPTTWAPGLDGLGVDGLEQIDLNPSRGFSFKRFTPDSKEAQTLGLEDVHSFSWKALIAEILVLQHPRVRECRSIIDLYGISWDVQVNRSGILVKVLPVLVFEKPVHGSLDKFLGSRSYQTLNFEKRLSLCRDIGRAIELMHSFSMS